MSLYGANPEQLDALGATLARQVSAIEAVSSTVSSALSGTTWTGPARDRFEEEWRSTFRGALDRLNQAFEAAGRDCRARATELQRVMGAI